MVWGANSMGDLKMCEGTIDVEVYIGIVQRHTVYPATKMTSFLGSETISGLILHLLQQSGFLDTLHCRVDVLDRSVFYRKCIAHHEKVISMNS